VKRICVVTTSRADYGIYLPVLRQIEKDPSFQLQLLITGSHLSPDFGFTVREIAADGFDTSERVEMLLSSDTPAGISIAMGLGMIGFAQSYARLRPDLLLVLGDRFEMHAAVSAALPFKIPVAHIHGGELSEGAIDDALRHSITKMSHLHFVATEVYAKRVRQMGEEPWRITVSGAPALDNLKTVELLERPEIEERYNLQLEEPFLLVTYHPVTLEFEHVEARVEALLAALADLKMAVVFTYPNADTGSRQIIKAVEDYAGKTEHAQIVVNLGMQGYFSMMKQAAAMVGNSSSGIIEAASFQLPVVNIGNRQRGRLRAQNVIDVGDNRADISEGIRRALDPEFRSGLANLVNPYGDGIAAERIVARIKSVEFGDQLLTKRFQEQ